MTQFQLALPKTHFVLYKDSTKPQKVPYLSTIYLPCWQAFGQWLALLASLLLLSGCGNLARLAKDIRETGDQLRVVSGRISAPVCKDCEIIIAVSGDDQGQEIHNYRVFERSGNFRLAALRDSRFLIAFQDLNRDFSYQANEPAVWYKLPEREIKAGDVTDIELLLQGPSDRPVPPTLEKIFNLRGSSLGKIDVQVGDVLELDDERFSHESASMGMWEPIGFMKSGRAGIFFLEPYDPARIPVLFVHGINGTPRNFRAIIKGLDHQRFQPWVLNYPSGLDLRALGDGLIGILAELRHRYGFNTLHFVAHSMGGLMVREYMAECTRSNACDYAGNFVSISTPFDGVASTSLWIDYARVVMPVWRNLVPDGPFLSELFKHPLPPGVRQTMLITYRNTSRLSRDSGDGVIPLESQLRLEAQRQAVNIRGFNEDHTSVLQSSEAIKEVNQALLGVR
jgi:pimeloyl-ACP methyl ester carboxylesterase